MRASSSAFFASNSSGVSTPGVPELSKLRELLHRVVRCATLPFSRRLFVGGALRDPDAHVVADLCGARLRMDVLELSLVAACVDGDLAGAHSRLRLDRADAR